MNFSSSLKPQLVVFPYNKSQAALAHMDVPPLSYFSDMYL